MWIVLIGVCWLLFSVAGTSGARVPSPASLGPLPAWRWPLDGTPQVTRRFDPPDTPYGSGHRGVDLAGRPGAVVRAAGAGRVGYAGVLAGRGVVTVLHAGGLKTTYEPVRASVHAGAVVAIGAVLGRLELGHPGCPVAACLHWGLLRGATYLDPLSLVGAGRVRLLPLRDAAPSVRAGAAVRTDVAIWIRPGVPGRRLGPRAGSGPWMSLLVDRSQPLHRHVGIDLRRSQTRVPEQFLHGPQVRAAFEEMSGGGVSQAVRTEIRGAVDLGEGVVHETPHGTRVHPAAALAEKQGRTAWPHRSSS